MQKISKFLIASLVTASTFVLAGTAFAATPILSVTQNGSSYILTVNNADSNVPVTLYELQSPSATASYINSWGTTDSNGNLTVTQGLPFNGTTNPLELYVVADGLQSSTVNVYSSGSSGCTSNCGTGTLSLSQSSISLSSGQTNVITAYPTTGTVYISSNSNTSAVSATANGDQITISALATGSSNVTVCANSGSQCNTILVSVNGGTTTGISFSNSSPTIILGQSQTVNVYSSSGSSNGFYISSNSNSNTASATVNGSVISLYGQNVGSDTITVCQNGSTFCSPLTVTVGSTNGGSGSINISTNTLTLSPGQSGTATVSNSYGTVYVASNSNSSVVSAGVSGQTITVYAIADGTSTLSICQNGYSGCVSLSVLVSGANNSISGTISFGTTNPVVSIGQSQNISIYSPNGLSSSFYISSNSNSGVVNASVNGTLLYLTGVSAGSSTINVCSTTNGYCGSLFVTVNGSSGGVSFSQSTVTLNLGQSSVVTASGGNGVYVLTGNTSPSVASASVTGSSLYITALNDGTDTLTVCQSGNSTACGTVFVNVGNTSTSANTIVTFSTNNPTMSIGQTQVVNIFNTNGYSGSYSVSNNSNPSVASVSVNVSTLSLTGLANGSTSLTLCETGSSICGSLTAAVGTGSTGSVTFSTTSPPAGAVGQSYNYQLQASGGNGNYTYSIANGSLPSGLVMSGSGLIYGTPTVAVTTGFSVLATDTSGNSGSYNFNLVVNATPTVTPTPTPVTTNSAYPSGELINENGTVSIVYQNTKIPFTNAGAFTGLGFSFANAVAVSNSGLPASTQVVSTASAAHPWGSWVLNAGTVYFVQASGLIPVPDWSTFLSNGGQASFIVPANSYDMALPQLSIMSGGDSRVQ